MLWRWGSPCLNPETFHSHQPKHHPQSNCRSKPITTWLSPTSLTLWRWGRGRSRWPRGSLTSRRSWREAAWRRSGASPWCTGPERATGLSLGWARWGSFFLEHFYNNLFRWQCSAQLPRPAFCPATLSSSSTTGRWRPWSRWASSRSFNIKWHAGQADSALSILLAAGFSVQLAWITSKDPLDPGTWQPLHTLWYKPDSYKYNDIKIVRSLSFSMNRFISGWNDYENPKGHMSCLG